MVVVQTKGTCVFISDMEVKLPLTYWPGASIEAVGITVPFPSTAVILVHHHSDDIFHAVLRRS